MNENTTITITTTTTKQPSTRKFGVPTGPDPHFNFQSARIEKHGSMVNNSCIRNSETRTKSETLSKFNGEATRIKKTQEKRCMENAAKILSDGERPAKIQPRTPRNKEIE